MIKLMFISHSSSKSGGAEDDFLRLLEYFSKRDNIYELYGIFPDGPRAVIYSKYCKANWNIDFSWFPLSHTNFFDYLRYFKRGIFEIYKLWKIFKLIKLDLCLINVSVVFWPILFCRLYSLKSIIFIRENIQNKNIRRWYQLILSKLGTYYFAVSKSIKSEFISNTNNKNISVLYSSIEHDAGDTTVMIKDLKNVLGDEVFQNINDAKYFKILQNASIVPIKNQFLLLKALKLINEKQNYCKKYIVFFIGQIYFNDKYYQEVISYINANNLHQYCYFLGVFEKNIVYEIYKYVDIVVLTSISEGLPLVMVEALKLGKPFISTNLPGIAEIIEHKQNGFLVDNNVRQLADAIIEVTTNVELSTKLVENGRKTFNIKFNLEKNMLKIESKVNEIINSSLNV